MHSWPDSKIRELGTANAVAINRAESLVLSGWGLRDRDRDPLHCDLFLHDLKTGKQRLALKDFKAPITAVAFIGAGDQFLSVQDDGTLRLWETDSGSELLHVSLGRGAVSSVVLSPDSQEVAFIGPDGLLGVKRLLPEGWKTPTEKPTAESLNRLWTELANRDAKKAYRVMHTLAALGAPVVAHLRERLRPIPLITQARLQQLIRDLDADTFARREAASRELTRLGNIVEQVVREALAEALAETKSLEVRRRVVPLVKGLPDWRVQNPEQLRVLRAIGVLQRIGSREAKEVLHKLAAGAPAARQTQAAKAARLCLPKKPSRE
jgi:hypothetical protein